MSMTQRPLRAAGLAILLAAAAGSALAQGRGGGGFSEITGKDIYEGICQGCHMPDAKGAVGAGAYPALASDKKFASKEYPAFLILKGQKAMPGFATSLDDAQVANVVNYIRANFGNKYKDQLTPEGVKALRAALPAADSGVVKPPG